jgi:2-oxoglutarate dehydrogenase complex dehydrogenase (E1) component-like enzyme
MAVAAPVLHVNADSMEDVAWVFKTAAEYRQKFNRDIVIDLIGYRKMGHNELDQPSFT